MGGGEGGDGGGDGGEDLLDGEALADYAGGHYEGTGGGGRREVVVEGGGHAGCVFETAFACYGVCAAGVDDYGADAFAAGFLEGVSTYGYRGGLEDVLCEDCSCGGWYFGGDEGEIRETGVGWFDSDVSAGDEEAFGIGTRRWYILLFGCGYKAVNWS